MSEGIKGNTRETRLFSSQLVIIYSLIFLNFLSMFMRVPFLPVFGRELGASALDIGLITAIYYFFAATLAAPFGRFSDVFGRKAVIQMGMAISTVSSLAIFFSTNTTELLIAYSIGGIGLAGFIPAISSYVGDVVPRNKIATGYAWFQTFMHLGMSVGPALAGAIAGFVSLKIAFFSTGGLTLIGFLLATFFMKNPPRSRAVGTEEEVSWIHMMKVKPNIVVLAGWLMVFGISLARGPFELLFPFYASEIGLDLITIGLLFSIPGIVSMIIRIPIASLSDRMRERDIFIISGSLLFVLAIALVPRFSGMLYLSTVMIMIGVASGFFLTPITARIAEGAPPSERGFAMGGSNMMRFGGFSIGSLAIGAISSGFSFNIGFFVAALFCLSLLIVYIGMVRTSAARKLTRSIKSEQQRG